MDKIKRYVEDFLKTTKVKEKDQLYTDELDACKKGHDGGSFRTICTLFDYGYAKGYRAAKAEMKKRGGIAV